MEFPFGHHRHTHHHGGAEEEDYLPPPPSAQVHHISHVGSSPPPPPSAHVYHVSHTGPPPPPPSSNVHHISHVEDQGFGRENYRNELPPYAHPPPPSASVHHVSHQLNPQQPPQGTEQVEVHHSFHLPGFLHHHSETHGAGSDLSGKPTVRVFCKAKPNHSLTILDGKVILAPSDQTDVLQVLKKKSISVKILVQLYG